MSEKTDQTGPVREPLRAAAEALLPRPAVGAAPADDALQHELRVRQVELEMQNEALRQAQFELEESRRPLPQPVMNPPRLAILASPPMD
ncbi:MAG: hypothetical protein IPI44_00040 [Sulfuritalea sp.]|nr:hypothetical protein [Sulfuritalea sp.]